MRAHLRDEAAPRSGPYAWRRFLRIVPAYWVALTVTTIWLGTSGVFNLEGIARYYGYAQIYSDRTIGSGMAPAWTLCVEITFYVFLPVWALLMRRVARGWRAGLRAEMLGVMFLFCFSIVWTLVVLSQGNSHILHLKPELVALPAYLDHFALGMGLTAGFFSVTTHRDATRGIVLLWQVMAGSGAVVMFIVLVASLLSIRRVLVLESAIVFRG